MELPTTNVAIPILENADVPISQTQFQRIDLDSLDYDPGTRMNACLKKKNFAYLWPPRLKILRSSLLVLFLLFIFVTHPISLFASILEIVKLERVNCLFHQLQ